MKIDRASISIAVIMTLLGACVLFTGACGPKGGADEPAAAPAPTPAPQPTVSGNLTGTVFSSSGASVSVATVSAFSTPVTGSTDAGGKYALSVDAGEHTLLVTKDGTSLIDSYKTITVPASESTGYTFLMNTSTAIFGSKSAGASYTLVSNPVVSGVNSYTATVYIPAQTSGTYTVGSTTKSQAFFSLQALALDEPLPVPLPSISNREASLNAVLKDIDKQSPSMMVAIKPSLLKNLSPAAELAIPNPDGLTSTIMRFDAESHKWVTTNVRASGTPTYLNVTSGGVYGIFSEASDEVSTVTGSGLTPGHLVFVGDQSYPVERDGTVTIPDVHVPLGGGPLKLSILNPATGDSVSSTVTPTAGAQVGMEPVQTGGGDGTVTLSASSTTLFADGNATATITAEVKNYTGTVAPNVLVSFSTTSGTFVSSDESTANASTNNSGRATTTLTSPNTVGTGSVTAAAGGVTSSPVIITYVAGPIDTIILGGTTTGKIADGTEAYTLLAQVKDAQNRPMGGQTVSFTATGDKGGIVTTTPPSATTAENGTTTVAVTDLYNGSDTETVTVEATSEGKSYTLALSFTGTGTTGPTSNTLSIGNTSAVLADGVSEATITVTLKDSGDNPLPGEAVTLSVTGSAVPPSQTLNTDPAGQASYTLTNTVVETVTVTATGGGVSANTTQQFVPVVKTVTATAFDPYTQTEASGVDSIQVTFQVRGGTTPPYSPVSNQLVSFTAVGNLGGIPSISPVSSSTNSQGNVTVTITDETAETVTVTATAAGIAGAATLYFKALDPANIVLKGTSPDPPVISISGAGSQESATLTFELVDKNDKPVQGSHLVEFSILAGGLNGGEKLTITSGSTVNSEVSTVLNSGAAAGTIQVRASLDSKPEIKADVTITITGGLPSGNAFGLSAEPLNKEGRKEWGLTQDIRASVADFFSNPVAPNVQVQFQSDYAEITGSAVFQEDGNASSAAVKVTTGPPSPVDGFVTIAAQTIGGIHSKVLSIAVDPIDENTIYAGTDGGGIFKTIDKGNSWSQVGTPLKDTGGAKFANLTGSIVRDIVIDVNNSSVLYAATEKGLFVSLNAGENWTVLTGLRRVTGDNLGAPDGSAYKENGLGQQEFTLSFDHSGVRSRTQINVDGVETTKYVFSGSNGIKFFDTPGAVLNAASVISADYDTLSSIADVPVYAVTVNSESYSYTLGYAQEIFAGTYGDGVWKTSDGGRNWKKASTMAAGQGLSFGSNVLCLAINSRTTQPAELFAGTEGDGLFSSEDGAATWKKVTGDAGGPLNETVVQDIVIDDPAADALVSKIWIGGKNGIHYTTNLAAVSWSVPLTTVNAVDKTNTDVRALARDTSDAGNERIYAATYGDVLDNAKPHGGIYISGDADGTTYTPAAQSISQDSGAHALDALAVFGKGDKDQAIVYAGSEGRSIWISADSGASWNAANGLLPTNLTNTLYTTMNLMHSGDSLIWIVPYSATYQPMDDYTIMGPGYGAFGSIYNGESHAFYIRISDDLGNRLTPGSSINIAVDSGSINEITKTLADGIYGGTDYYVTWTNDETILIENITGKITVTLTSDNGNLTGSLSRTLIKPLEASEDSITFSVKANQIKSGVATGTGGSDTEYIYSILDGSQGGTFTINATSGAYSYSPTAAGGEYEDLITITDKATGATVDVNVSITITAAAP